MGIITQEEIARDIDEFCQKNHVGKVKETAAYKELVAAIQEMIRENEERKAREGSHWMLNASDVAKTLGVSKSSAYKYIAKLNKELEEANYLTVRGKISKAYFEKRVFGIDVDAE